MRRSMRDGRRDYMSSRMNDHRTRGMDYRRDYTTPVTTPRYPDYSRYPDYYNRDMRDMDDMYKDDIMSWIKKLERKDRFGVPMEQVITQAKNMGVRFDDYEEYELYATYLMLVSDFKNVSNDYNAYIQMAKEWLEDDDIGVDPSEKLCKYYYEIVLGDK